MKMTFERFCEIWDEVFPEAPEETKNAEYSRLNEDVGSSEHLCKALLEAHAKGESLALTDWAGDYAIFDVNEMAKLEREIAELKAEILRAELLVLQGSSGFERENADLRKDKRRLDWLLGDTGSRYVEKDMALGTWDASEVFETREGIDRVMELEGGDVEQRGLWRWHNAEPEQNIPEELFDGNAVYDELTQAERRYTTPAAVSAVLDATVSLIRMGIKKGGEV